MGLLANSSTQEIGRSRTFTASWATHRDAFEFIVSIVLPRNLARVDLNPNLCIQIL